MPLFDPDSAPGDNPQQLAEMPATGGSAPGPTTLTAQDLLNIQAVFQTVLAGAGIASSGAILIDGGLTLDISASGSSDEYGNLLSSVGDTGTVDIVVRDNSARIPLDGWSAVGNMFTEDGAATSTNVACVIEYGAGGVVRYPRQATDTETAGRYLLKITLTGPGAQKRTIGPLNHIVS